MKDKSLWRQAVLKVGNELRKGSENELRIILRHKVYTHLVNLPYWREYGMRWMKVYRINQRDYHWVTQLLAMEEGKAPDYSHCECFDCVKDRIKELPMIA
jgi:hypothetical protein